MTSSFDLVSMLESSGALQRGHFRLSSGRHAKEYVQCALLLEEPTRARQVGAALAARVQAERPSSVVSPALGGVVIGYEVASALDIPFRFTERREGKMLLRRGFSCKVGERVAVVEDVVTTGRSTLETIEVVEATGAKVVAVGSIIDRAPRDPFRRPFHSLLQLELESYEPTSCPECADGNALVAPGSRPAGR